MIDAMVRLLMCAVVDSLGELLPTRRTRILPSLLPLMALCDVSLQLLLVAAGKHTVGTLHVEVGVVHVLVDCPRAVACKAAALHTTLHHSDVLCVLGLEGEERECRSGCFPVSYFPALSG